MKPLKVLSTLAFTGLAAILTLSSFYQSCEAGPNPSSNNNSEYYSTDNQTQRKDNLKLSAAFENDYYTRNNRVGYFYAELKADEYNTDAPSLHVPLNLSVVIDRSGSMAGEKIRNAKQAAKYIVDQLGEYDYLSIVIYDGTVDVLQPAVSVHNKQLIKNKIDNIYDRGGTNLMGGALEGYAQVKRNYKSNYVNRVLLLSDGLANEGITAPREIENIVRNKNRNDGISISTFGVGRDYNEDLMTAMAENGTGNYYFIDNPESISSIFKKELNGLHEVIAQNATLRISIPEYVNIEKVFGYKYDQQGRTLSIQFHDVFANDTKGVLIKYRVQQENNTPINFRTSLAYNKSIERESGNISLYNKSEFTNNESLYNKSFNEWVGTQVAIFESNETLESAMKEVDKGHYEEARKIVKQNNEYIKSKPAAIQNAPEMQGAKSINASYDSKLSNIESLSEEDVKYIQKDTKSSNYQIRAKKK